MPEPIMALRVRVTGVVQGVGYRDWARRQAEALGVSGWARNEADGSVSLLLAGERPPVDQLLHALWDGPAGALVTGVHADRAEPPDTEGFAITA